MSQGVIYVATGPDYLELARASARSLRATNPGLAIDLFTDQPGAVDPGEFDQVHPVPRVHARAKLECLPLSRFKRTLYLDCDTLVVGDLGDMYSLLDRFDLALAHEVRRASDLIQEGLDVATPYAFPQMNSGVILYRKSPETAEFFAQWALKFHASAVRRDQIILKDMLWDSKLQIYVLPPEFNLRRVTVLDAWEPEDCEVKIIHSHRLMDHMRVPGAPRITDLKGLLNAEREALEAEWKDVGQPNRVAWFGARQEKRAPK
ncbi:MAG: hypothetical protein KUG69_03315 [Marinosulfonomonas sp.]|nr:hypothetical protein [Marinosulfonomonas sp.]